MKRGLLCLALLMSAAASAQDEEGVFDIRVLPPGADVTRPHPATTVVPMHTLHRVIPTDYGQVLKLTSTVPSCSLSVSLYDKASPEVRTVTIRGGDTLIYHFKKLNTIMVNTEPRGTNCQKVAKLMLESNRPLGVGL